MNVTKANRDFEILKRQRRRQANSEAPRWSKHTWRRHDDNTFELFLFEYRLPPNARPRTVHLRIEGRKNLYDPAGDGKLHFYRNVWFSKEVKVPATSGQYVRLPRLYDADSKGWFYVCVHPSGQVKPSKNVLSFLRVIDLYVKNAP